MSLELFPLATMVAELREPKVLPKTPAGTRMIYEVESGHITGERLRAELHGGAAADWLLVGPDGTGTLDVRSLVETDDGALIFIQYRGRVDLSTPGAPLYSTPRFETGDPRYSWLNKVQAVGKGELVGNTLTYELYELR
ncbi:MAG TPA: DUF3237 domain-containing protein [Kribbellaceae bacterium]|nr:DUF3237 domain-containing protein [Kribbellaceae bacterium]